MLIALHGARQSGKDTADEFLVEHHPDLTIKREGFADRLKVSAAKALGFQGTTEECIGFCNALKEDGSIQVASGYPDTPMIAFTGREYLQWYGFEAHREVFGQDFWIKSVLPDDLDHSEIVLVITDVRFDNEAQAIRDHGGKILHITRPEVEGLDPHASEKPLSDDLIDIEVTNHYDLDFFENEIRRAWAWIRSTEEVPHG